MISRLDRVLDSITTYRLVLYILIFLVGSAAVFSLFHLAPFSPAIIVLSSLFLFTVCYLSNKIISQLFNIPSNIESSMITALILSLIVTPAHDLQGFFYLLMAGTLAMGSKYLLALNKKHIFNPAAIAVVFTSFLGLGASWWVGTLWMSPLVLICGLLIVRKLQFEWLVASFFGVLIVLFSVFSLTSGQDFSTSLSQFLLNSPVLFFGFVMLTEPSTLPPTRILRILYGGLIGLLNLPQIHLGNFFLTPELTLVIGNIFSYLSGSRQNLVLKLSEKKMIASSMWEFNFLPTKKFSYRPGQYMEWTLPHKGTDSRGNRRYFTLASSPTEESIKLGVRFSEKGSSYKNKLLSLDNQTRMKAGSLAGDFTLPKDKKKKIAFVAGGIGITPFRSIIKFLLDKNEKRDIVLFYSNTNEEEIAYKDIFDAAKNSGIRVVYTLTGEGIGKDWDGERGRINQELIRKNMPDYEERLFYVSGSLPFVNGVKQILKDLGVKRGQIKTDFFPGYA